MANSRIRKIAVATGSRAEFGILRWLIEDIHADPDLELALIVTGSHWSKKHGETVNEIVEAGFPIAGTVRLDLSQDDPQSVIKATAECLTGMCAELGRIKPDIIVVLGDRYEMFATVQAAMMMRIPVAHIAGGDITEGAMDDAMRHAMTKMSHLHFPTNVIAADRIRQMGEDPARIIMAGSPALDNIKRGDQLTRADLEAKLSMPLGTQNILVTFHPVTLAQDFGLSEFEALLDILADFDGRTSIWITQSNADSGGSMINDRMAQWAAKRNNAHIYASLGIQYYMALMRECDLVIGNSSSGLYEAPSFGVPTVDIGNRQAGRLAANSVFRCSATPTGIRKAIGKAKAFDRATAMNPYGDGHSSARILQALRHIGSPAHLLRKKFHSAVDVLP
jgi:UDP-hydrolysing UDP-N-acetyl-D-glucosamine 2-epimerase